MSLKKLGVIAIFFFLITVIFSVNVFADSCSIKLRSDCYSGNTNNIVMGLSSETNAHAELWNQANYDYVLCCDFTGSLLKQI
jgi:hypothetical protein